MEVWQVLILGAIQGASEFLPISSTAHLVLAPYFFGWPDLGLAFNVALHLGTLLAIAIFFWGQWRQILASKKLLMLLALATLPGVLAGFFFETQAETTFRAPLFIAFNLVFFGLFLGLADFFGKKINDWEKLGKAGAILTGIFQAIAILPGVSRSGATMTGGLVLGLKREAAVKFSFLLSAPIIFGSVVWEGRKLFNGAGTNGGVWSWILGVLISFASGYLAIKFLSKFVQKKSLWPFVIYRLVLALVILLIFFFR